MAARMAPPPPPQPTVVKGASLYVGDLQAEVTEVELSTLFSKMGPLHSVRLCRDRLFPYKSLCYAYINFFSPFHASMALALLNHTELKGKAMRIMWCQRDPHNRNTGVANLFVKNLDYSITSARLHSIFSQFGAILSCKVAEENGKSKGFGFVQFDLEESAFAARVTLHDSILEGKKLYVSKFFKKSERKDATEGPKISDLYVKNIDEDVTEDILWGKFSDYGKVYNVSIMKDNEGKSKGFGFVNFESHEEAQMAMESLNGTVIGSKKLFVGKTQKKAEREEHLKCHSQKVKASLNLYVKSLNLSIDDRKLKEIFSSFGEVTSAKVMRHDNGFSKGFGFVSFSNPEEANKAVKSLNGTVVEGRPVYVAVAQRKEERNKGLQIHFTQLPAQPFYTSNWDVLAHPFLPRNYSNPLYSFPAPASRIMSRQPNAYQYLANYEGPSCTLRAQSYQGNYSNFRTRQLQGTSTTNGWVYQHHSMGYATSEVPKQKQNYGVHKDVKLKKTGNMRSEAAEASPKVKFSSGELIAASSPREYNKTMGKIRYPMIENIQPEHAAKLNKSDIQKILQSANPQVPQVGKAVEVKGS